MPDHSEIEELTQSLGRYAHTSFELVKLEATERGSGIGAGLVSGFIMALISILFLFFISLWAGFFLSAKLGDSYSGFPIVAGVYLLLGIVLWVNRKKMIEKPLRNSFIKKIVS